MPRQLANVTHAHLVPPKLYSENHAIPQHHGILVEISLRYPPVQGRLHTRYAPVRRSPAVYCYTPLPLDLHVLSLPLAFILSQDQTLHCKNCFLPLLTRLRVLCRPYRQKFSILNFQLSIDWTHAISIFSSFQISLFSGRKRLQKYNLFPF